MTGLVADEKGPFCLHRRRAAGNAEKAARAARVGASFRAPRGPHAEARLRSDARGRDGGVRQELAAGIGRRPRWKQPASCHLEREDYTLKAWYPFVYAPRAGGAYDSHHRTAGIAGRTRRRGGVAARGARAATSDAGDRVSEHRFSSGL